MEIEDILEKRTELNIEICDLLRIFERDTGFVIQNIEIDRVYYVSNVSMIQQTHLEVLLP